MTISTVPVILDRIKNAEPESPIAVFYPYQPVYGQLDAMPVNTVKTKQMLTDELQRLVGVYDKTQDFNQIFNDLSLKARLAA